MNFHSPYPRLSAVPTEPGNGAASRSVVLYARRDVPLHNLPAADLSNVIPFARRKRADERDVPLPALDVSLRPAPQMSDKVLWRLGALLACSLAAHVGLLSLFNREAQPLASLGVEVISAEIILGDNRMAGLAQTQTKSEDQVNSDLRPSETKPEDKKTEVAQENPQVKKPDSETMVADKRPDSAEAASEQKPAEVKAVTQSKQPAETKPSEQAKAPEPEVVTEKPAQTAMAEDPLAPPAKSEVAIAEPKFEKPEEVAAEATPKKPEPKEKAATVVAAPKNPRETRRASNSGKDSRDRSPAASEERQASSGFGIGRSDANSNYRGIVFAHLVRYKRYPSDARSRGEEGTATVTFTLSASGSVTSAKLSRSSGSSSIDQEAVAMVHRAAPFPAPPDGKPSVFVSPIGFAITGR